MASITGSPSLPPLGIRNFSAILLVCSSLRPYSEPRELISKGWLCFTGWQAGIVTISFITGTIIQGLITLNHSDYVFKRWHGTLLIMAIATFCVFFNTVLARKLPLVEGLVLIVHVLGLFAIIIPLWTLAPRNNAHAVFTEFSNTGGWSSTGLAVMVGLLTPISTMLGFDCSVHMCRYPHLGVEIFKLTTYS